MSIRTKLSALAIVAALAAPSIAAAQEAKIAYVDLQRALLEVRDGKAAKARLQNWLDARQKEIDAEQAALRKEKETLDRQASGMDAATRAQKSADLERRIVALAAKWERSREEASGKERQEMEPIVAKIDQVVATLAERDGLAMVFERRDSGLVYARPAYDLTNEVIRVYDSTPAK